MNTRVNWLKIEKGIMTLVLLLTLLLTLSGCAGVELTPFPSPTMAALKPTETPPPTVAPMAIPTTAPTNTPIPPLPTIPKAEASPTIAAQATPTPAQYAQEIATALTIAARPTTTPISAPFHLTAATEVQLTAPDFRLMGLDGDTAVGAINVDGEDQIVLLDLNTGQIQQISSAVGKSYKTAAHISARWVVWREYIYVSNVSGEVRLMVYDRQQGNKFSVKDTIYAADPDLSGDIVVWADPLVSRAAADIVAYNLATGQKWIVIASPPNQFLPRISGDWVIYLEADPKAEKWACVFDLRAHQLTTGEDFLIGHMPYTDDARFGTQHAIAGHYALWVTCDRELHVYDLDQRTDRAMFPGTKKGEAFLKVFGDDALVFTGRQKLTVYNLMDSQLRSTVIPPDLKGNIEFVHASGKRVVWSTLDLDYRSHLYTVQLP